MSQSDLLKRTAFESKAQVGSFAHVAYCAEKWLEVRAKEKELHEAGTFLVTSPEQIEEMKNALMAFWHAASYSLKNNAFLKDLSEL